MQEISLVERCLSSEMDDLQVLQRINATLTLQPKRSQISTVLSQAGAAPKLATAARGDYLYPAFLRTRISRSPFTFSNTATSFGS